MLKEINRYFNQISQTDISISRVYNVRFLECHSVLKVARRWTVREARLSPGACSTQTYMYTCTYVCMLIYINICRVSLQMVLVSMWCIDSQWLPLLAGGHLWLLHSVIFGNSVEIFICCYSFEIYI